MYKGKKRALIVGNKVEIWMYRDGLLLEWDSSISWKGTEMSFVVRDLSYWRMSSPGTSHFNKLSRQLCVWAKDCVCLRESDNVIVYVLVRLWITVVCIQADCECVNYKAMIPLVLYKFWAQRMFVWCFLSILSRVNLFRRKENPSGDKVLNIYLCCRGVR